MPRPEVIWYVEQNPYPGGPWHVFRQYRRAAPKKVGGKFESKEAANAAKPDLERAYRASGQR